MSTATHPFELDAFQLAAVEQVDRGVSVLVAAPTGAGKTVVAEHAVAQALHAGQKAFYTAPIKALSNQKYADLVRRHGSDNVGLLTGDNVINGDAPVVVMTTEVLRNMIYAASPALDGLRWVVLDEVHYLQDPYRGPVWEEILVHAPPSVRFVCLSATVSNADELADWISTVRGRVETVLSTERPVALENLYMVADATSERLHLVPTLVDGEPNREANRFDAQGGPRRGRRRARQRSFTTPRRVQVIDRLADEDMLPAINFVFSRAGCDDAVAQCVRAGVRLTDGPERERIAAIVASHVDELRPADLEALGYDRWLTGLLAGVAAHHAGMVPAFKEAVEACFVEGLVRVVFATETLALGINMPARSVVIERLTKFNGDSHQFLTPLEYTQLTGRAGRRGIDDAGFAVVLWSPFVSFGEVASLASSRSFPLRSVFKPTYNMAASLVRRYSRADALRMLNLSFAQYQADREVVRLEQRLRKRQQHLAELTEAATSEYGDTAEYVELTERLDRAGHPAAGGDDVATALSRLRPGDVIDLPETAAVLSVAHRKGGAIKLRAVTRGHKRLRLEPADFDEVPEVLGTVELPKPYAPNSGAFQHEVIQRLQRTRLRKPTRRRKARGDESDELAERVASHPVTADPDLPRIAAAARRLAREQRSVAELERRARRSSETLAHQFSLVLDLLGERGYIRDWTLTGRGEVLAGLFHECDLLVAEAVVEGLLDGLGDAELAALVSVFTYEHRSPTPAPPPRIRSKRLRARLTDVDELADALRRHERATGLSLTRGPEHGFIAAAASWAEGAGLDDVLDDDLTGGDFVRNVKQLVDLLRQIGTVAPDPDTARQARRIADELVRGVVSASSAIGDADPTP